ncbi:MAG TPA: DUF6348 family protein [Gemmatimonadaceae bacterium]|nr:DUF6348 family protein [Gemmatimonadaceae bacterium]
MDDALIDALAQGLKELDLGSYREDGAVRFRQWPTVAVTVGATSVTDKQDTLLLHADLAFAYNASKPDSLMRTCVTGVGSNRDEAAMDAASEWVRSWAPPLISVLNSAPVLGAEWFPASTPDTVPGWDAVSSPYVLRGLPRDAEALTRILETTPLLGLVREELPRYLDASSRLHSMSLFVGAVGKTTYAEVQINGQSFRTLRPR